MFLAEIVIVIEQPNLALSLTRAPAWPDDRVENVAHVHGIMGVVRLLRILAVLLPVVILASCTSNETSQSKASTIATVCGHEYVGSGVMAATKPRPAPDANCPGSGPTSGNSQLAVTITASAGRTYIVYPTNTSGVWGYWSVRLPAGSYEAVGWACRGNGARFAVKAGETLRSVSAPRGCLEH